MTTEASFFIANGDELAEDVGRFVPALLLAQHPDGTATVALKPTFADWQIRYACPVLRDGEPAPLGSFARVEA